MVIRGGALSIKNATGYYVFGKGVAVFIFVRLIMLILGAAFFLLHLWSICITFEGFITFVVNYYGLASTDVKGLLSENFNIKTKSSLEISNEKGYSMSSNFRTDPSG